MSMEHLGGMIYGIHVLAPNLKNAVSKIDVKNTGCLRQSFQMMTVLSNDESNVIQE
jgi:hypothetical protein